MQTVRQINSHHLKRLAIYCRGILETRLSAQATIEAALMATYDADDYKTKDHSKNLVEEIIFVSNKRLNGIKVQEAMDRGQILGEATNLARKIANEPGNRISPSRLAEKSKDVATGCGLEIKILGEPEMRKMGMNTVLAVAEGSNEPARFIILKHFGAQSDEDKPIVLVGKGVTFDSGGLSLKPPGSMEEMKLDKSGACAVLAAMQAIAQLRVDKNVVGLIPAVENLPGGKAIRPGDVIQSMSGKTIEILNTDAEGRLILADALFYAQQLTPQYIVDLATLTGACVVALGHLQAGLFSNNDTVCEKLLLASERSGEKFWRLPLDDEYRKDLDTQIADIKTAAKFLQEFVGEIPWCHIDMAGVDLFRKGQKVKGPTGFGVRTLVEMVSQ